jgi:hypothetical protein
MAAQRRTRRSGKRKKVSSHDLPGMFACKGESARGSDSEAIICKMQSMSVHDELKAIVE